MTFSQPIDAGGRVVAAAQVTGHEYLALANEFGHRVLVAVRTNPGQLVLNHQSDTAWSDDYTHVPIDIMMGEVIELAIFIHPHAWDFQVNGQTAYRYAFPTAGSPITYAEGGGAWRRVAAYF